MNLCGSFINIILLELEISDRFSILVCAMHLSCINFEARISAAKNVWWGQRRGEGRTGIGGRDCGVLFCFVYFLALDICIVSTAAPLLLSSTFIFMFIV